MAVLLGCIADDFTGGTDLAGMLVKYGMRTVQMIGVPNSPLPDDIDAVVIALKSRTSPGRRRPRSRSPRCADLQSAGCRQFYFKYCSTFDSTPRGNIGPVAEALMEALDTDFTIACPAFPANRRTIYKGYLFVGDVLLNESGMRNHPLTPMTDANLVRVLQAQTKRRVGLVEHTTVAEGPGAIAARFAALRGEGYGFAIVDALSDDDLVQLGVACADMTLVTAGSGVALGLPQNFRRDGLLPRDVVADALPAAGGSRAVIAGSCSTATQGQVAAMREHHPAFHVDPNELASGQDVAAAALDWAAPRVGQEPVLDPCDGGARGGEGGAGAARRREGGRAGRGCAGRHRARLGEARGRAADRGRRRDLRRRGEGAGREGAAHRAGDRSRRAVDRGAPGSGQPSARAGAEIGQFRQAGLLPQGVGAPSVSAAVQTRRDENRLREDICALGRSMFERGLTGGSSGNISVRLEDGWLFTPTNASLGRLDPARLARLDGSGKHVAGVRPRRSRSCTGPCTSNARGPGRSCISIPRTRRRCRAWPGWITRTASRP